MNSHILTHSLTDIWYTSSLATVAGGIFCVCSLETLCLFFHDILHLQHIDYPTRPDLDITASSEG